MGLISRASRFDRWLILIFFGFIGAFSTFQLHDLDTWFHLKAGELILQRGTIPATIDFLYTVSPGSSWQDSYWLFQVIVASVYRLGGVVGLCLLRVALIATLFALLWQTIRVSDVAARSQTLPSGGCRMSTVFLIPCLLLAALAASNRFRIRPDLFTLLLIAGCLYLLHAYRAGRERLVWLLPLLQVVWVNSHQLFPLGLILVAAFLVGEIIAKWMGEKNGWDRRLVVVAFGMGVACLLNPYGHKMLWSPLPAYSQVQSNPYFIAELVPPFSSALPSTPDLFWYPILITVSALSLLLSLTIQVAWPALVGAHPPQTTGDGFDRTDVLIRDKTDTGKGAFRGGAALALRPSLLATHLLLCGIFLYLSLMARRNVALFAVVAAPIAAIHLREVAVAVLLWAERRGYGHLLKGMGAAWRVCLAMVLVVLTWQVATDRYYVRGRTLRRFGLGVSPLVYPQKAVDFILSADLPGNLFNGDEVGHYFTWRAYPRKKSFIDGTFPGGELVGAYQEVMKRPGVAWDLLVQRYHLNYVLLNHTSSLAERLLRRLYRDKAWKLIYFDELSVIFIRDLPGNREIIERFTLDLGKPQAVSGSGGNEGHELLKAQSPKIEDQRPVGSPGGDGMYETQPVEADGHRPTLLGGLLKRVHFPAAQFNRGNFFFRVADLPERAAQEYEAGLRTYPNDPLVHNNLAAIYHQLGRFDRSIEHYREALRLEPGDAEIHFNLALAYRGKGLAEQEEAEYRRALELKPDFQQARLQLGLFYLRRGERDRANQELRQVMGGRGFHHPAHSLPPMAGGP